MSRLPEIDLFNGRLPIRVHVTGLHEAMPNTNTHYIRRNDSPSTPNVFVAHNNEIYGISLIVEPNSGTYVLYLANPVEDTKTAIELPLSLHMFNSIENALEFIQLLCLQWIQNNYYNEYADLCDKANRTEPPIPQDHEDEQAEIEAYDSIFRLESFQIPLFDILVMLEKTNFVPEDEFSGNSEQFLN